MKDTVLAGKQEARPMRIIGMSCPIANGKDVAAWLGVALDSDSYFNFAPSARPQPIEATILQYD